MDHGDPASYLTLASGTDVLSSDGVNVGTVRHVLADAEADVFDGLVIDVQPGPGGLRFVDADDVDELFERAAVLRLPAADVDRLQEPRPAPAVMESRGEEDSESPLAAKLHRAWDLISGNY